MGDPIRQEPLYSDALAVARETMTRVRHNIEILTERLRKIGYQFEQPEAAFVPPKQTTLKQIRDFEREVGPVPVSIKMCAEIVGSVDFRGNYPGLSYYAPSPTSTIATLLNAGFFESQTFKEQAEKIGFPTFPQDMLDALKDRLAREQHKSSAQMSHQDIGVTYADPLCIAFDSLSVSWYETWQEVRAEMEEFDEDDPRMADGFTVHIAPDLEHKSNFSGSGGYNIALPNGAFDAPLLYEAHQTTLVNYLRISFQWAGFPGLADEPKRDNALLDQLRVGLLPF
ncbi:MAG: hypothetical protein K8L91_04265 [Anaerolineae bacterium]|nr:hypothetical protein [Anaerolineae bacterium]